MWECISTRACETFPDSFDTLSITRPAIKTTRWDLTSSVAQNWAVIVTEYSNKQVTFKKDKLVALSGIARLFAAEFGTTYLAGMWKEDLMVQLLWFALEPSSDDIQGIIPSWSWAAVDKVVYNSYIRIIKEHHPLVSILEATSNIVDDMFGDVRGGTLRIKCSLPLVVRVVEIYSRIGVALRVYGLADVAGLIIKTDRAPYSVGQELYILPLIEGIDVEFETKPRVLSGLVIEPVSTDCYRRTGYFETYSKYPDEIDLLLKAQKKASYEDKFFVGEALGPDAEGKKMCIITLI